MQFVRVPLSRRCRRCMYISFFLFFFFFRVASTIDKFHSYSFVSIQSLRSLFHGWTCWHSMLRTTASVAEEDPKLCDLWYVIIDIVMRAAWTHWTMVDNFILSLRSLVPLYLDVSSNMSYDITRHLVRIGRIVETHFSQISYSVCRSRMEYNGTCQCVCALPKSFLGMFNRAKGHFVGKFVTKHV